ncbi:hypothetical protein HOLleu_19871 [Holothuria leucospilota]|uniref:Uncharacterized protein n=1 Tax=Holothuria leucospilota TaxID=206669 RepID=A0A9Q1C0Q6_HOLLE|nr:hypothetical protein HOLleu_19871 [Holothuria leucospilota]
MLFAHHLHGAVGTVPSWCCWHNLHGAVGTAPSRCCWHSAFTALLAQRLHSAVAIEELGALVYFNIILVYYLHA